jgi:hypothetical protein
MLLDAADCGNFAGWIEESAIFNERMQVTGFALGA